MAKPKGSAGSAVTNRAAYSRVSFLYQAAALLAAPKAATPATSTEHKEPKNDNKDYDKADDVITRDPADLMHGMARRLLTQMRAVSRKTNMRVRPAVKHKVCKYCDTLLVDGTTCVSVVENHSRGGRKPWADVLAVSCITCGRTRRYPVTAPRQPRRPFREGEGASKDGNREGDTGRAAEATRKGNEQNKNAQTAQNSRKTQKTQKTLLVSRGKDQTDARAGQGKKGQAGASSKQAPG